MCGKCHGLETNHVGADKGNFLLDRLSRRPLVVLSTTAPGVRRKAHDFYLVGWIIHGDDKVMMVIKTTIFFGRFRCRR